MNKPSFKITAIILCAVLCLSSVNTVFALTNDKTEEPKKDAVTATTTANTDKDSTKDETVYVLAGADGSVQKIIVSDWIKNALGAASITDSTGLSDIENVKGNESYTISGNAKVWDAQGNDIYYRGNIEKELPVGMTVTYTLDGKKVSADEIAGKTGKVSIRFDYDNRQYEMVKIDGKEERIYVPFAMLTGMLLDNEHFRNVEVTNGKIINDGDRTAVVGIAFPGLQENLGISKDKLNIPDYVEITADASDFSFGMTVTFATNELFNNFNTSKLDSVDDLTGSIGELSDGMKQLLDGSSALYGGLTTLLDKSKELVSGINQLADGAKVLKDGAVSVDDGAGQLKAGAEELAGGLNTLKGNNDTLNGGAKQVFETLLSTAETQIKAGGISVSTLTIDNYAQVLTGVIKSLDETSVYNQALAQVTAAVENNRPLIVEKVTAAVREQVAAGVTAAVREQVAAGVTAAVREQVSEQVIVAAAGMSKSDYEAAVSAGMIPAETQNSISAAIEVQMQTNEVKALLPYRNHYRYLSHSVKLDFLPARSRKADPLTWYGLSFRIVRFPISGDSFEVILTNLPADDYPPDEIKRLYSMRWGIETSFRELKYNVGLNYFHSCPRELIIQEFYARLILYNMTMLLISCVKVVQSEQHYRRKVSVSDAVVTCRDFLIQRIKNAEIRELLLKYLTDIRPDRKYPRKVRSKRFESLTNRT